MSFIPPTPVPFQVAQIDRERKSLKGWRAVLQEAATLIDSLATLKGAHCLSHKIRDIRHELRASLAGSDIEVLRNTTSTADLAIAMLEAEKLLPGKAWLIGRGRSRPGEPLYGFAVFETREAIADDEPLVMVEHEDPRQCVALAVQQIKIRGLACGR